MDTHAYKTHEVRTQTPASVRSEKEGTRKQCFQLEDNRTEAVVQRKLQEAIHNSPRVQQLKAYQQMANDSTRAKNVSQLQSKSLVQTKPAVNPMHKTDVIQRAITNNLVADQFNVAGETNHGAEGLIADDQLILTNAAMGNIPYYSEEEFNITLGEGEGAVDVTGDNKLLSDIHIYELASKKTEVIFRCQELLEFKTGIQTALAETEANEEERANITVDQNAIIADIEEAAIKWGSMNFMLRDSIISYQTNGGDYGIGPSTQARVAALTNLLAHVSGVDQLVRLHAATGILKANTFEENLGQRYTNYTNAIAELVVQIGHIDTCLAALKTTMPAAYQWAGENERGEDTSRARSLVMNQAASAAQTHGLTGLWKIGNAHVNDIIANVAAGDINYNLISGEDWNTLVDALPAPDEPMG